MITAKALEQTLRKLGRLEAMLYDRIFQKVGEAGVSGLFQTEEPLHAIPEASRFAPLPENRRWGGEGMYGWFRGEYTVPEQLADQPLFLFPRIGGYEATLWVDGVMTANYANKELVGSHGNHYAKRITAGAPKGTAFALVLEYYAFHDMPGTQPFQQESFDSYEYPIGPLDVCTQDTFVLGYWADLRTLLLLCEALPASSFRRADVLRTLYDVHVRVYYDQEHAPDGAFRQRLEETRPLLAAQLAKRNGPTAPYVGLIGHSHMDTAWLWPMTETVKKCARTYANQLSLMAQYPEYLFVQSSAYHTEMIREHYPELFEGIRAAVAEGRYEPNGGVWVECDCNLTGGEAMVRQFVWGQRYTQKHFGYRSDSFWLPDTFGYSAAIPQIMRGCGVEYFLTTKIAWNDTTKFPYTSFWWQGLDGTRVLTHFNRTHVGPDPRMLIELTEGGPIASDPILEKPCSDMRLFSYGKGDGGGGPEFEMIEMARRVGDLEGVARSSHTTVGAFMQHMQESARDLSVYAGELYLELHRGTLTNLHNIKRNNRLAEIALHTLEAATVHRAVTTATPADGAAIDPLTNTLLVNQFHDILPGTCIHSAHQTSLAETGAMIASANAGIRAALGAGEAEGVALYNPTGFARRETVYLPARPGMRIAGEYRQQLVINLAGEALLAVEGVELPPYGSIALAWVSGEPFQADLPCEWFEWNGNPNGDTLATPFARIVFDTQGGIASYVDIATGRELRDPAGFAFNTFLMAEDVSAAWDNWDIDADLGCKFEASARLLSREVVSQGAVELRIRSVYALSERSTLTQDMVFSAASPQITFDTLIDWQDTHRFLKTAFDTALLADGARHEIQFGHIRRGNHRNTDVEKARFEVCNHKFTDLSEAGFGVTLLNDCKYGISVEEGHMRLSLHKGGDRPDPRGDCGLHSCRYAFLPHGGGFSAQAVVQPAYAFNYLPVAVPGGAPLVSLLGVDAPGVVVETIKPCEDADKAYIVRLYEAEGGYVRTRLHLGHPTRGLTLTNMLEEPIEALAITGQSAELVFHPFEIKTVRVAY